MIINKMREPSSISKRGANTIGLKSFVGDNWHVISLDQRICNCEQFQVGQRCEHLGALGIYRLRPFTPTVRPTFSQALSGLVKSIRIRRVDEAVYWLVYLDTFKEKPFRFRTARRLLIGSAEDGHSIPVMEMVADSFRMLCKPETDLWYLVSEAIRICKLPNWWQPDSGGPDYIYHSLVGWRKWLYKRWDHRLKTLEQEIASAIDCGDRAMAIGGVTAYASLQNGENIGATKQAEFLLRLAEERQHDLAIRLCNLHLSHKSALSADNNFLCMSAWMMAGGVSPVAAKMELVTIWGINEVLEKARAAWKTPHPIPRWCCDGIHCAGQDTRFAGMLPMMMAVCRAYQHYGRVDPADKWLPSFRCFDGLIIDAENVSGEVHENASNYLLCCLSRLGKVKTQRLTAHQDNQ